MAWTQCMTAQTSIEQIRKHYSDVKECVNGMADPYKFPEDMDEDHQYVPQFYQVNIEENYPGTGMHHEKVFIYHADVEGSDEGEVFPPQRIEFATAKYNFAAREFYEEYLYDAKGQIEFVYAIMPEGSEFQDMEYRFYFKAGKLIKADIRTRASEKDPFKEVFSGTKVSKDYEESYQVFLGKSAQFKKLFEAIYAVQQF